MNRRKCGTCSSQFSTIEKGWRRDGGSVHSSTFATTCALLGRERGRRSRGGKRSRTRARARARTKSRRTKGKRRGFSGWRKLYGMLNI
jgi:hypothetical protein